MKVERKLLKLSGEKKASGEARGSKDVSEFDERRNHFLIVDFQTVKIRPSVTGDCIEYLRLIQG